MFLALGYGDRLNINQVTRAVIFSKLLVEDQLDINGISENRYKLLSHSIAFFVVLND